MSILIPEVKDRPNCNECEQKSCRDGGTCKKVSMETLDMGVCSNCEAETTPIG